MPHPRYSSDEIARREQALYDNVIKRIVEPRDVGKYVAIDIESGEYEVGDDHLTTSEEALAKHPGAALYVVRAGYAATARIGGRLTRPSVSI